MEVKSTAYADLGRRAFPTSEEQGRNNFARLRWISLRVCRAKNGGIAGYVEYFCPVQSEE